MDQETINKMRSSSYLLPDPGGAVVRECLEEIERMKHAFRSIADSCTGAAGCEDKMADIARSELR